MTDLLARLKACASLSAWANVMRGKNARFRQESERLRDEHASSVGLVGRSSEHVQGVHDRTWYQIEEEERGR